MTFPTYGKIKFMFQTTNQQTWTHRTQRTALQLVEGNVWKLCNSKWFQSKDKGGEDWSPDLIRLQTSVCWIMIAIQECNRRHRDTYVFTRNLTLAGIVSHLHDCCMLIQVDWMSQVSYPGWLRNQVWSAKPTCVVTYIFIICYYVHCPCPQGSPRFNIVTSKEWLYTPRKSSSKPHLDAQISWLSRVPCLQISWYVLNFVTIWLFNIAMENPLRMEVLAGKIIFLNGPWLPVCYVK
jgi:hypothetical protein